MRLHSPGELLESAAEEEFSTEQVRTIYAFLMNRSDLFFGVATEDREETEDENDWPR